MRPLAAAVAVLILMLLAPRLLAHDAISGWKYDNFCCGGNDCQMITLDHVEVTPEGYVVTLAPGDHVTAKKLHRKLFRYGEVRQSGDEHFHACILPNSQEFRCLSTCRSSGADRWRCAFPRRPEPQSAVFGPRA